MLAPGLTCLEQVIAYVEPSRKEGHLYYFMTHPTALKD